MVRQKVLVGIIAVVTAAFCLVVPAAHASSVGSGACETTVDNTTGVTVTVASDGACVVTFATASTSPTTSGQFATRSWSVPNGITSVDVLVVAGGGGGGSSNGCCFDAGAGGGGGVVVASDFAVTAGQSVTVLTGQGGQGTYCGNGFDGGRSQFSTLIAIGGGRGGGCGVSVGGGGSGGGAHCNSARGISTQASTGTPSNNTNITSYGSEGGLSTSCGQGGGGGGGGATEAGSPGTGAGNTGPDGGVGGRGGEGIANSLRTGSPIVYGSGGGGQGYWTNGDGGTNAGDGSGTNAAGGNGIDGVDQTGGGGGAGWRAATVGAAAGDGGSGVVIVRYYVNTTPVNSSSPTVTGTTTNGQTLTGTRGTWSGYPAPSYSYRWKRATSASGTYNDIASATSLTYTLSDDDIDKFIKFEVTATNSSGATSDLSPATSRIVDLVRPTTTTVATPTTAPALVVNITAPPATFVTVPRQPSGTASTTTSTVPISPTTAPVVTTTTTVPAPRPATVDSGEAAVVVGSEKITPTIERRDNKLIITAGDYTASLAAVDSNGKIASLDKDGNIRISTRQRVQINASGFEPKTMMEVWLFSTPKKLGEMSVDSSGSVSGTFEIPADTSSGSHRMVIVTKGKNAEKATLTIGLMVGDAKQEQSITPWVIALPIIFAILGALILPATRRRRRRLSLEQ